MKTQGVHENTEDKDFEAQNELPRMNLCGSCGIRTDFVSTKIVFTCRGCGKIFNDCEAKSNLKGFYRRNLFESDKKWMLDNGKPIWEYAKWNLISGAPKTNAEAAAKIESWIASGVKEIEFALVQCAGCNAYHNQADWAGTLCPACSGKGILKPTLLVKNPVAMKNGEFRKLPKSSSPLWTTQWAVQGTAKLPYVVSHKQDVSGGSVTDQGWACSCPNFTQHMPRTECKHVLKIMMSEGAKPNTPPVAALPDDQQEAFQKFLRQQAERGTPAQPAGKARPLFTTGRRFR